MDRERPVGRWMLVVAGLLLAGALLWFLAGRGPTSPSPSSPSDPGPTAAAPEPVPTPASPARVALPAQRIAEHGRLTVEREALREGDVLAIGLGMPDDARGDGERPVTVVDVEGRVLRTTAAAVDGTGSGLRLELDPDWLLPGRYMIEVATAEPRPMALRRYVLEVR
jgi:hypothetical protein